MGFVFNLFFDVSIYLCKLHRKQLVHRADISPKHTWGAAGRCGGISDAVGPLWRRDFQFLSVYMFWPVAYVDWFALTDELTLSTVSLFHVSVTKLPSSWLQCLPVSIPATFGFPPADFLYGLVASAAFLFVFLTLSLYPTDPAIQWYVPIMLLQSFLPSRIYLGWSDPHLIMASRTPLIHLWLSSWL